jgi:hypothetical protein
MGNAYKILVGTPERKRPLGGRRRRCKDNIEVGLREIGWRGVDWMRVTEEGDNWRTLVNTVMNILVS